MAKKQQIEAVTVSDIDSLLKAVKRDINKDFSVNSNIDRPWEFLSTGNCAVNFAFSGKVDGGFPMRHSSELLGLNSTGKSLLAAHALIETQKRGGIGILIDSEFSFNPEWYKKLGGNTETLIHFEPDHIEQSYDFLKETVLSIRGKNKNILITCVYDSLAATPGKAEFDGGMERFDMGKRAIAHGKGVKVFLNLCAKHDLTFIGINQYRKTMCVSPQTIVDWKIDA